MVNRWERMFQKLMHDKNMKSLFFEGEDNDDIGQEGDDDDDDIGNEGDISMEEDDVGMEEEDDINNEGGNDNQNMGDENMDDDIFMDQIYIYDQLHNCCYIL